MKKLLVQQNQMSYAALFSHPAFALWGDGRALLNGLFTAFSKRGVTLANFRFEQGSQEPAAQALIVSFGTSSSYKFQLDRVESVLRNYPRSDLEIFPGILQEGADWLRSAIPDFSFESHLFTYYGHSRLSEGTGQDVLAAIPTMSIPEIGASEGNGIIFHWNLPERGWKIQLLIDHSLTVPDGLFIQFFVFITRDSIDYSKTTIDGRSILDTALQKIGLEIDDAT
jgi:hypothetical protein